MPYLIYEETTGAPTTVSAASPLPTTGQILTTTLTVTTTGSAGSATGSAVSAALSGGLLFVHLNYHASAPATTVVTLTDAYGSIVAFAASKTDARWYPVAPTCDTSGTAIASLFTTHVLTGAVTATVTACDALTGAVVVTLAYVTP